MISVIIPILNDTRHLSRTLAAVREARDDVEVLVVDGGSEDGVEEVAQSYAGVRLLTSPPGRARQMNAGAGVASGDILLFLHVDTLLPPGWSDAVTDACKTPGFALGAFKLKLDSPRRGYRLIERAIGFRTRACRLPYGDQALFMRKQDFERVGRYPDLPVMEDVELVWKLRRTGRMICLPLAVVSSPRNWERDGILRRTARNWGTYLRHRRGLAVDHVARYYRGPRQAVIVFCKAPVPGKVKTRLAADIGAEQAASLYRQMVANTLKTACACPGEPAVSIFFDPASAERETRAWLGPGYQYVAQEGADLGQRMLSAFSVMCAAGYREVVIIGTDCPELQPDHLHGAFRALRRSPVVLGPSHDGGYYLIGAREPHPKLFADIPWSTGHVLGETRSALDQMGLPYRLLEELRDMDDQHDLAYHRETGAVHL